jgi:thymidine phosphorylase
VDSPERHLKPASLVRPVFAREAGRVASIDTRALGLAVITLGGGRRLASDAIDHSVGLSEIAGIGASVDAARPLCLLHAHDEASAAKAEAMILAAYRIGEARAERSPVLGRIG